MSKKLMKFSFVCVTGALLIAAKPERAYAYEEYVAGIPYEAVIGNTETANQTSTMTSFSTKDVIIPGFHNIGIANVDTNLLIRKGPGEKEKILGKMPKNAGCEIIERDNGSGWTKVRSGKVTGYVKSEYLITGQEASILAKKVGNLVATSNTNGLRVRKGPTINSDIVDQVAKGEELIVLNNIVVNYKEQHNKWVKVSLDSDGSEDGEIGYVAKEYVNLSYELKKAFSMEELQYGVGVSSTRVNLVNKAKKYLGYPYVWGGNNLEKGVDCSGYTRELYKTIGISIPRHSGTQAKQGTRISASQLKPGDLVFYGNNSVVNHVAIFIGNGKIIHASNRRDGIKISNMNYRKPMSYARYIRD